MKVVEEVLVQSLCVLASSGQPAGDGRLLVAEDPFSRRSIQSFGQRRKHLGDLLGWRFQAVQRGVAPGSEGGTAGLAAKGLDPLGLTMLAIADQRVDVRIGDSKVQALRVGTSESFSVDAFGGSPPTFYLTPGVYRTRNWPCTQRGSGGEMTEGTIVWGAWLQQTVHRGAHSYCLEVGKLESEPAMTPKPCQRKDEEEHEQEHVELKSHKNPRCLKWGA